MSNTGSQARLPKGAAELGSAWTVEGARPHTSLEGRASVLGYWAVNSLLLALWRPCATMPVLENGLFGAPFSSILLVILVVICE